MAAGFLHKAQTACIYIMNLLLAVAQLHGWLYTGWNYTHLVKCIHMYLNACSLYLVYAVTGYSTQLPLVLGKWHAYINKAYGCWLLTLNYTMSKVATNMYIYYIRTYKVGYLIKLYTFWLNIYHVFSLCSMYAVSGYSSQLPTSVRKVACLYKQNIWLLPSQYIELWSQPQYSRGYCTLL